MTMKCPGLYLCNALKTFGPKLEFFKSWGLSEAEIAQILSSELYILERSLKNRIIPSVNFLRHLLGTDDQVVKAIKACYRMVEYNLEELLKYNNEYLMKHGVPKSNVLRLLVFQPKSLLVRNCRFIEVVDEVKRLGFDPSNLLFVLAVGTMGTMTKLMWVRKLGAHCSFGLSEGDVVLAFKKPPLCMCTSEKKIQKMLTFFVNELKLKPSVISENPNLMLLSLESRIIPRCLVLQLLISNNLIKEDTRLVFALVMTEKMFVGRFVDKYKLLFPEVVKAYEGKVKFRGFPVASTMCMNMRL